MIFPIWEFTGDSCLLRNWRLLGTIVLGWYFDYE